MKRSQSAPVALLSAVAGMALAAGCGGRPTHQQVCGDATGVVVEAEKCDEDARRSRSGGGYIPLYHWFYAPYGRSYAPGTRLTDASRIPPSGKGVRIAGPTRGGFGGTARSAAG